MIVDSRQRRNVASISQPGDSIRKVALWLCVAAVLAGWLPRLHWGFWTDEAGTFWMAAEGWRAAITRTMQWPGQSVLYSVLESFFVADGFWREPLLRLPALLAAVVAAWHLRRLAELLIGAQAGWPVMVCFFCLPDVGQFATNARPYSLALAASLASFHYLIAWQRQPDWRTVAKYLAAAVLTIYLHYLFAFVFVIQAAYLLFCRIRGERVPLGLPVAAAVVLPVSLLPLLQSLLLTARSQNFSDAAPPAPWQLLKWWFPPVILLAAGLGAALLLVSGRDRRWRPLPMRPRAAFLLAAWLIPAPLLFFAVSRLTPQSLFSARYLLFTAPAFLLLLAWGIAGLRRPASRVLVLLAIFAGTVLHPGVVLATFHPAANSWREPLQWIAAQSQEASPPVFIESGIANTSSLNWQTMEPHASWLFSPLLAYPIRNEAFPLPYEFGEDVKDYVRRAPLEGDRYFLLASVKSELGPWMSRHMKERGFEAVDHPFNDYEVVEFRR